MNAPTFSRPRRNRPSTASASDAFLAGATADAIDPSIAPTPTSAPSLAAPLTRKPKEREVTSQNVRFTEREKAALIRISEATKRSEHFIIKEILGPALLARAADLDEKTAAE